MRGRNNNNNRKGPNPLTRNYESNGPDVKIRGSAQQIAEKYAALARDAQSAGDRVMAENYLQHAEHYNRIIAAAQAQMPIQNFRENRGDDFDDDLDEERDGEPVEAVNANQGSQQQPDNQPPAYANGNSPQPVIEGTPAEVALNPEAAGNGERPRGERPNGFHGNGFNGEENFRRNRRSRRGRGGRPDAEQAGEGGETQSAEGGDSVEKEPAARRSERRAAESEQQERREEAAEQPAREAPGAETRAEEPGQAAQD